MLRTMKTAISLPDDLFHEAEQFAQAHDLSRSELYACALAFYPQAHQQQRITDALNQVYADESSVLDPALRAAQAAILVTEDW